MGSWLRWRCETCRNLQEFIGMLPESILEFELTGGEEEGDRDNLNENNYRKRYGRKREYNRATEEMDGNYG